MINIIKRRASTKKYQDTLISDEILNQILECGTCAPTGRNLQSPIIICVKTKTLRDKLSSLNASILNTTSDPFYNAPIIICVLADKRVNTYIEDGSLVLGNMMIASEALNVGSCWIHRCKEMFETKTGKELLKEWNIPDYYVGVGNLALGLYETKPTPKQHKENYIIYK